MLLLLILRPGRFRLSLDALPAHALPRLTITTPATTSAAPASRQAEIVFAQQPPAEHNGHQRPDGAGLAPRGCCRWRRIAADWAKTGMTVESKAIASA